MMVYKLEYPYTGLKAPRFVIHRRGDFFHVAMQVRREQNPNAWRDEAKLGRFSYIVDAYDAATSAAARFHHLLRRQHAPHLFVDAPTESC